MAVRRSLNPLRRRVGVSEQAVEEIVGGRGKGAGRGALPGPRGRSLSGREAGEVQKEKEKERDGTHGFMGGMRRISLVGKHKRSKNAASLAPCRRKRYHWRRGREWK